MLFCTTSRKSRLNVLILPRRVVSNFEQTMSAAPTHPSKIIIKATPYPKHVGAKGRGVMHDAKGYRSNGSDCLMAAQDACRPGNRGIHLSMAASWLALARESEAMDRLLASWEAAKPVKNECVLGLASDPFVSGNR